MIAAAAVRSGCPSTVTCAEFKGQLDHHIRDNRGISSDETASEISIR